MADTSSTPESTAVVDAPAQAPESSAPAPQRDAPISRFLEEHDPEEERGDAAEEAKAQAARDAEGEGSPSKPAAKASKAEVPASDAAPASDENARDDAFREALRLVSSTHIDEDVLRAMTPAQIKKQAALIARDRDAVQAKLTERSVEIQKQKQPDANAQSAAEPKVESSPPSATPHSATLEQIAARLASGSGLDDDEARAVVADLHKAITEPIRAELEASQRRGDFAREASGSLLLEFAKQGLADGEFKAELGDPEHWTAIREETKALLRTRQYDGDGDPIGSVRKAMKLALWSLFGERVASATREHEKRLQGAQRNGGVSAPARRVPARVKTGFEAASSVLDMLDRKHGIDD